MKNSTNLFSFVLTFLLGSSAWASATIVRNGGDALLTHLRSMSASIQQAAAHIQASESPVACVGLTSAEAIERCQAILTEAAPQLNEIISTGKVSFELSETPLEVRLGAGKQTVGARTQLGPNGNIEVYRNVVMTSSSRSLLFLITHEYLHKIKLQGKYVDDEDQIPGFADGRHLIDTLAKSLVAIAEAQGYLAFENGVRDVYSCSVQVEKLSTTVKFSTPRRQLNGRIAMTESSLGQKPLDAALSFSTEAETTWKFRFFITTKERCNNSDPTSNPQPTTLQIVREQLVNGKKTEEIVLRQNLTVNPICDSQAFGIKFEDKEIRCQYLGSENESVQH